MYTLQFTEDQIERLESALAWQISSGYTVIPHPIGPITDPDQSPGIKNATMLLALLMKARGASDEEVEERMKKLSVKHY